MGHRDASRKVQNRDPSEGEAEQSTPQSQFPPLHRHWRSYAPGWLDSSSFLAEIFKFFNFFNVCTYRSELIVEPNSENYTNKIPPLFHKALAMTGNYSWQKEAPSFSLRFQTSIRKYLGLFCVRRLAFLAPTFRKLQFSDNGHNRLFSNPYSLTQLTVVKRRSSRFTASNFVFGLRRCCWVATGCHPRPFDRS